MSYSEFKAKASSEKITLATLNASKRLMGWTLYSGSIYSLPLPFSVLASVKDSGSAYTEVSSLGAVVVSSYYHDRTNGVLYLHAAGGVNPNSRFLVGTLKFFFATSPVALAHDLASGFEVYWEPQIKSTSQFGVEIDTVNQTSEAIEGSGSLSLHNDQDFWPSNFDKLYFDNQDVKIYSYGRDLAASEAKLIFSGKIETKSYGSEEIRFSLKDIFSQLRAPIELGTIGELALRTGSDLALARQRMILGRVSGHVPVNVDQVLDGYPITGTVSVSYNSSTVTGVGTVFLTELSPDDRLILGGEEYTVATVASDTSLTLSEAYTKASGLSGATTKVIPDQPKRWMNRIHKIAGHALREPVTEITVGSSISRLTVSSNEDIYAGDWLYIGNLGSGELVQVEGTFGKYNIKLATSLATIPAIGTAVRRPSVQNVRIGDTSLVYYKDYTLNASTATITLLNNAEANSGVIRQLIGNLSFTSGSRTVTGTSLQSKIKPGYMVGVINNDTFFEVMSVDSDTQLTLRTVSTFTSNTTGRYKPFIFDPSYHTITMDVLGKTDNGTSGGALLKTAPSIVKTLIGDVGLSTLIDSTSFEESEYLAPQHVGLVVPSKYNDKKTPTYRDVINEINKSVLGNLIQTSDFRLSYYVLRPNKPPSVLLLDESDILSLTFGHTSEKMIKTAIVEYKPNEIDYLTNASSVKTQQKTSDIANYIVKSNRSQTFITKLVEESDAKIAAYRWSFILEHGSGQATLTTKLQAIEVDVGDVVRVSHRKLFKRYGITLSNRLFLVESVKRSGFSVELQLVDISAAFSRVANITDNITNYTTATDEEKLFGGYYTDVYGLINNNPESSGTNLIW